MADWLAIEGEYRAGTRTLVDIAADHDITEGAIRKRAKKLGWTRDPAGLKRELVRAALSGTSASTNSARRTIEASASEAASDMQTSLEVARAVLQRLLEIATSTADPRALKTIVEANKLNVETIRLILSLDDPVKPDAPKALADIVSAMREVYGL